MPVSESDFAATLLDKLKLEDPWLPPSSWESITSESGPRVARPAPSSDHRPLRRASSVSEASLVRLAMNALQGVQSALISIEKISTAFCSDPADRTFHQIPSLWNRASSTHAQGKILKSIGCSGFLIFLLRRFVDYFRNSNMDDSFLSMRQHENPEPAEVQDPHDGNVQQEEYPPYSLVNHAFSVAVGKIIEGYICALDTLYASVQLRHSSESAQVPLEVRSSVGCLTTVVHSEITLLELYLHTKEVRTHIEALGNICNLCPIAFCFTKSSFEDLITKATLEFRNFCRGGDLLTYLYAQLQVADPPHRAILNFLFLRSCEPYYGFIRSWIYKAEINDPYKEFIVEQFDNFPSHHHGKADMSHDFPLASVRERDGVSIPCFLRDYSIPLVRAGQQLQVLMKLLEFCTYVVTKDLTYEDLLPCLNEFSSDHSANACPITFNKVEIEARVLARANYYKKMQEKLESVITKLEFRYQQVVSHDITLNGIGHGLKSSNDLASFKLDTCWVAASAEDKRAAHGTYSEDSSTRDDLSYTANAYEPSDCSSSTDSEEIFQSEQLTDLSSYKAGLEEKYLSALSFSVSPTYDNSLEKPCEGEKLHSVESDLDGICGGRDGVYNCQKSRDNGMLLDQISMTIKSEEPKWPVNGLWKRSISVYGSFRDNSRSNLLDSEEKVKTMEALMEGNSYYRKMIVVNDTLPEELFGHDQQENNTHSTDLFKLKDWNVSSHNNFLSINPMLTRNTFTNLQTGPGETNGKRGQSLPYFDFSSVEDPCKGSLQSFSSGCTGSRASVPNAMSDRADKKQCDKESLINRTKIQDANPLPDPKDYKKEDTTPSLVSGGSSWESLLGRSSTTVCTTSGDHTMSSLAKFDMPLDFIIGKCLQEEIMLQYKYVSKLTIKLLEEGFDFKEHLLALRRYHFMELADWADLFIISLSAHKWCITEAEQRLAEIQGFLELSIQRSSCEFDPNKDRLYVYMKGHDTMPLTTSAIGLHSFDFLGLGYRVDWPVSIVLTSGALRIYSDIFSFLIKLKLAIFSLTDVWRSLKELRPLISLNKCAEQRDQEKDHFSLLVKMRHQVNHFVSTLQQYVESQLSHVSWCKLLHSLQHKVKDMMDLESVHMAYLIDSMHICFLSDETQPVSRIIDSILQCALDFRSCLKGGMWDIGIINQGDPEGKLSRIKISQVLSIKKTFDKNLQELRLYYLKSPKHVQFGLSRFWGYLNYNEYYSDVGNEMWHYSFSL